MVSNEKDTMLCLTCPAQGYPTPNFRLVACFSNILLIVPIANLTIYLEQKMNVIAHPCILFCFTPTLSFQQCKFLEPIGGTMPKFSSETDGSKLSRPAMLAISLTCPAQAHPVPTFR